MVLTINSDCFPNSINRLGSVFETQFVLYEEGQASKRINQMNFMLHRAKAIISDLSVLLRRDYSVGSAYRLCHHLTNSSKPAA
jgi:hypothetical protein